MKLIQRHAPLAVAMMIAAAVPAAAQNTVGNAVDDAGNAVSDLGSSIANGADATVNSIGNGADAAVGAVDNAVDVNITTADNTLVTNTDVNVTEPAFNEAETVTETTTVPEERSNKGNWGLLGLAGLLSFLFRPKRSDIHLDERTRSGRA